MQHQNATTTCILRPQCSLASAQPSTLARPSNPATQPPHKGSPERRPTLHAHRIPVPMSEDEQPCNKPRDNNMSTAPQKSRPTSGYKESGCPSYPYALRFTFYVLRFTPTPHSAFRNGQ